MDYSNFSTIVKKFQVTGEVTQIRPLGHGLVNHTFEVVCGGVHYVLQEINHSVFKYPVEVVNNQFQVTEFLREKIAREGGDPQRETLTFIRTLSENQLFQTDDGNYYRLYRMVENGSEMEKPKVKREAYEAASIIGSFQRRLLDFEVSAISATFPKMHDQRYNVRLLLDAVRADICYRTSDCQEQLHFVLDRTERMYEIETAMAAGQIPVRVTHNDPGYNNILVDNDTHRAVCIVDLDTVMPGCSLYDFGDAVRVGAATVSEFDRSGDVELDLALFRSYLEGYLSQMGSALKQREKELLLYSVWLMTMEKGMRYLTEYLNGDQNSWDFADGKQNLFCAVNQFFLVLDIEDKKPQMEQILKEVLMSAE